MYLFEIVNWLYNHIQQIIELLGHILLLMYFFVRHIKCSAMGKIWYLALAH